MRTRFIPLLSLVWALAGGAALAQQDRVQIGFADVERFADFGESRWDRERNQKELTEILQAVTAKLPAGQQLSLKVLDVNLAGELEWWRSAAQRLRVMRSVTWPMIEIEYTLSENGRVLKSEKVDLKDMNYLQDRFFTGSQEASQTWRYERRLLERWFKASILAPATP